MDAPFFLQLHVLEEGANDLDLVGSSPDLDLPEGQLRLNGPVALRGTAWRVGSKVEIQGTLTATAELICDRCLAEFRRPLEVPFRVFAERQESRDHRSRQEVREEDPGIVYHDGQSVSLTDEVRQILLVEAPWHVLCKEDCAGLCPRCGANRNLGPCTCSGGEDGPR